VRVRYAEFEVSESCYSVNAFEDIGLCTISRFCFWVSSCVRDGIGSVAVSIRLAERLSFAGLSAEGDRCYGLCYLRR